MPRRLLFKEDQLLTSSNPPSGYKFVGYDSGTFSERQSDGDVVPIGGVSTSNSIETNPLKYILNKANNGISVSGYSPGEIFDVSLDNGGLYIPNSLGLSESLDDDIYVLASYESFIQLIGNTFSYNYQIEWTAPEYIYPYIGLLDIFKGITTSYFSFTHSTSLSYYAENPIVQNRLNNAINNTDYNFYGYTYSLQNEVNNFIYNNVWHDQTGIPSFTQSIVNRLGDKGVVEFGSIGGEKQFDKIFDIISKWTTTGQWPVPTVYSSHVLKVFDDSINDYVYIPNPSGASILEIIERILDNGVVIYKIKSSYNGNQTGNLLIATIDTFMGLIFSQGPDPNPA